MNIFYNEHRLVLQQMLDRQVDFILIGGYAVNYHGYNRVTGDMDVWIKPDNQNKTLLLSALKTLGYDAEGISKIELWDFTKPQSFHVGNKPERTDFMTFISGVKYSEAKEAVVKADLDGLKLDIIHVNTLIRNKKSTTRTKDLADAEYLEKIMELRKTNRQ